MQDIELGERLKEERRRLGYNQTKFGEIGGVSKGSQILYEKGHTATTHYMSSIAAAGADINYIITGERSMPARPTSNEEAVLMMYRDLDDQGKKDIYNAIKKGLRMQELETLLKNVG